MKGSTVNAAPQRAQCGCSYARAAANRRRPATLFDQQERGAALELQAAQIREAGGNRLQRRGGFVFEKVMLDPDFLSGAQHGGIIDLADAHRNFVRRWCAAGVETGYRTLAHIFDVKSYPALRIFLK